MDDRADECAVGDHEDVRDIGLRPERIGDNGVKAFEGPEAQQFA